MRSVRNLFRRDRRSPSPSPVRRHSTPPRTPTPVPVAQSSHSDPSLHVHVPTRSHTPEPSSRASSVLTESSTETAVEEDPYHQVFRAPSPVIFAGHPEDIFEPEHHLFEDEVEEYLNYEEHIIENINQEITRNPLYYPALVAEFGADAYVPGTQYTIAQFSWQHNGARLRERQEVQRLAQDFPVGPPLFDEEELLDRPGYAGADDTLRTDSSPDITPPSSPHPSAGRTPVANTPSPTSSSYITSGSNNQEREGSSDSSVSYFSFSEEN